jgi:hypothetical protein
LDEKNGLFSLLVFVFLFCAKSAPFLNIHPALTEAELLPRTMTFAEETEQGITTERVVPFTVALSVLPLESDIDLVVPMLLKFWHFVDSPDIPPRGMIANTAPPLYL